MNHPHSFTRLNLDSTMSKLLENETPITMAVSSTPHCLDNSSENALLFLTIQPEDQLGINQRDATWATMPGLELIPRCLPLTCNPKKISKC
jgi:hypothetical protein